MVSWNVRGGASLRKRAQDVDRVKRAKHICPTCGKKMPREIKVVYPHTEDHIVEVIKEKHPGWVEKDGICQKCYQYYQKCNHYYQNHHQQVIDC